MPARKRTALAFGMLLLLAAAFLYGPSRAQQKTAQQPPASDYKPPTIKLDSDAQIVTLCPDAESMANPRVHLRASGFSPDGNQLRYRWQTSGGHIEGQGEDVVWDLTGVAPGVYNAGVTLESIPPGNPDPLCTAFTSTKVVVRNCPPPRPLCPNVVMSCPDVQQAGSPITFTASTSGGTPGVSPVYNWKVSAGTILSGQGTPTITVDTANLGGQPITAVVEVAGYNLECRASCQSAVPAPPKPVKSDEFGEIARDDEKARLDQFAIELQNTPGAQGYIIAYGGARSRYGSGRQRADRARDYLVTTRGIDASRIVTIDGGTHDAASTQLWIVPPGATPPSPR